MTDIMGFNIKETLSTKSNISNYYPNVKNTDKGVLGGFSKAFLTSISTPEMYCTFPLVHWPWCSEGVDSALTQHGGCLACLARVHHAVGHIMHLSPLPEQQMA